MNVGCPICGVRLGPKNRAKNEDGTIRFDERGKNWCKRCAKEFDFIDWRKFDRGAQAEKMAE